MITLEEVRDSLRVAVGSAFARANRAGQLAREDLYGLSMSGLGGCVRQAAYRIARVPPTDAEMALAQEARAAMIGTWIHAGLLEHLAYYLGEDAFAQAEYELRVTLTEHGLDIHGSTDLYTDAFGGIAVDVKSLYAHGLDSLASGEVKDEHWWQVMGYACAVEALGRPVTWVAWLYIDRSSGECVPVVAPFTDTARVKVRERIGMLVEYAEDPGSAPRRYGNGRRVRGPGDPDQGGDYRCNGCPWLRECFGPQARPGDPRARQVFAQEADEGVVWALRGYHEAHQRYSEAKKEKEFFMSVIKAAQPLAGQAYGGYRYSVGKPQVMTDVAEAERRLRWAGIPVPKKPKAPQTRVLPVVQ